MDVLLGMPVQDDAGRLVKVLHEGQAVRDATRASRVDRRALIFAQLYGVQLVPHQGAIVRMFLEPRGCQCNDH